MLFDEQYRQVENGLYNMALNVILKLLKTPWFKIIPK